MKLRLLPIFALCACTQFPELDQTVSSSAEAADYPTLQPLGPALAQGAAAREGAETDLGDITARVAALKARAARLRGSVVDPATRARMRRGVSEG